MVMTYFDWEPDFQIAQLRVWIHARASTDETDIEYVNSLVISLNYRTDSSEVSLRNYKLLTTDLKSLKDGIDEILSDPHKKFMFKPTFTNVEITFQSRPRNIETIIKMHGRELDEHIYYSYIEREELQKSLCDLERTIERFPVIGNPNRENL